MAGSKRQKFQKKAADIIASISPATSPTTDQQDDADDDGLLDDLLAQMDKQDPRTQPETAKVIRSIQTRQDFEVNAGVRPPKKDPKKRHQERQAKKAAALASAYSPDDPESEKRLTQEKMDEEQAIKTVCDSLGLEMHEITPDGHCLFSAVADQLAGLGLLSPQQANYRTTRATAAEFMARHPDDFLPFLPSVDGEDGAGATSGGLISPAQFTQYCVTVRDTGAWGGEPEIMALCRAFNVAIHVVQWGTPPIVCHAPDGRQVDPKKPSVKISYHRRMYGLGEHYNSLRPKRSMIQTVAGAFNGLS